MKDTGAGPMGARPGGAVAISMAWCAVLLIAACGHEGDRKASPPLPTATVKVEEARPDPATSAEDAPGTIRPVRSAILAAKVTGAVTEIDADPGRVVKREEVLARIDDREIRARLDSARATLEQASTDFTRYEKLHGERVVTAQEFEAARSRLRSAQAAVDETTSLLGYCSITAPFDGVVTRRFVQRGDLATPGRAIAEVEDPGALRLEAQVPESLMGRVRIGDTIAIAVDAARVTVPGKVGEIAPASDPASRTTLVKIDLPSNPALRSGMFGRARIPTDAAPSLRVPEAAVLARGQLDLVYVVRDGVAQLRIVRTGRREGGRVEILSGLDASEAVVVEGASALADGQAVVVH